MNKPKKNRCETCGIRAYFNSIEFNWGRFCKKHCLDNMSDVVSKKCIENGCNKNAIGSTYKCKFHGGGKRCDETDCNKSAVGNTNKCISHGGGKRCDEPECNNASRAGWNKCRKHGGGRRCNEPDCNKSAVDNTMKCVSHGGGKRCNEPGCDKSAQGKTDKCIKHGGGRFCDEDECNNLAISKNKCSSHGGGKRCPLCINYIDSRGSNPKYDGYCATCFKRSFPTDERSKVIYSHTKEIRIRNFINEHFEGFIHDRPLYTHNCVCTHRRRIDHRKLIGNTILAIETDEHAHRSYDEYDEQIRYDDVYMIHSGKWIFIRFNPDGKEVDIEDKLDKLLDVMQEQIERIEREENTDLVEIIKLFY
jgi:hypothetical protein